MKYLDLYAKFLLRFLKPKVPIRVVFDTSNGSTALVLRKIFNKKSVVEAKIINGKIDGHFPGHGPNPMYPFAKKDLQAAVKAEKADLGVIFDGDGDRAFFIDDLGRVIYQDDAALLLMESFRTPYVVDAITGWQIKMNPNLKGKLLESRVGYVFIRKAMIKADFGAENSGHYYFKHAFGKTQASFDSGVRAAIEMINKVSVLKKKGKKLSDWLDELPKYYRSPDDLNFRARTRSVIEEIQRYAEKIYRPRALSISHLDGVTIEAKDFWFNLRGSNTESLLRLKMEAKKENILKREIKNIKKIIKKFT